MKQPSVLGTRSSSPSVLSPNSFQIKHFLILFAMLLAASAAILLKPTQRVADQGPKIDLETMIPKQFGNWRADESAVLLSISPDVQEKLNDIYSSVLSRTYVNEHGERIMLSIAYGPDQNEKFQVHLPESCYPAQGFSISQLHKDNIIISTGELPVMRMFAMQESRKEPLTYWVVLGDKIIRGKMEQKLVYLFHTDSNHTLGGFIVRVSAIDDDPVRSYKVQDRFINDLLGALPLDLAMRLTGRSNGLGKSAGEVSVLPLKGDVVEPRGN